MTSKAKQLFELGQSIWYDNIERRILSGGEMQAMIEAGDIYGVTSNPSIFHNAIVNSSDYDGELERLAKQGLDAGAIFDQLAIQDIQAATDLFIPIYERTHGGDGYVSIEVHPDYARDTKKTIAEAARLWKLVDRPNLMIKIPATREGIPAVRQTIAAGINVNITLIFSNARYAEVIEAYIAGLEDRLASGGDIDQIASVASFFVSRLDSKIDKWLDASEHPTAQSLKGKIAVANAKQAYQLYLSKFAEQGFASLEEKGANRQRPLWASTSTKNPDYSDVLYVDKLIGKETVNTVPPKTLLAFNDHGTAMLTIEEDLDAANAAIDDLAKFGVSLDDATAQLEAEGVASFSKAIHALLDTIDERRKSFIQ